MIGSGALIECLESDEVEGILSVTRRPGTVSHPKLREIVHGDFLDFSSLEGDMAGTDACLFCLGVSAAGMSEEEYRRVTYDVTAAAAQTFKAARPDGTFIYVSGAGADGTGRGRIMWARVKGQIENHLLEMGLGAAYMVRPGLIQPVKGVTSRTTWYRLFYRLTAPLLPVLLRAFDSVTTTERLGRAMIRIASEGYPHARIESREINELAGVPAV